MKLKPSLLRILQNNTLSALILYATIFIPSQYFFFSSGIYFERKIPYLILGAICFLHYILNYKNYEYKLIGVWIKRVFAAYVLVTVVVTIMLMLNLSRGMPEVILYSNFTRDLMSFVLGLCCLYMGNVFAANKDKVYSIISWMVPATIIVSFLIMGVSPLSFATHEYREDVAGLYQSVGDITAFFGLIILQSMLINGKIKISYIFTLIISAYIGLTGSRSSFALYILSCVLMYACKLSIKQALKLMLFISIIIFIQMLFVGAADIEIENFRVLGYLLDSKEDNSVGTRALYYAAGVEDLKENLIFGKMGNEFFHFFETGTAIHGLLDLPRQYGVLASTFIIVVIFKSIIKGRGLKINKDKSDYIFLVVPILSWMFARHYTAALLMLYMGYIYGPDRRKNCII
jgi:hypothetical protein